METRDIERFVRPAMRQYDFKPSEIVDILETYLRKILLNVPDGKGTVSTRNSTDISRFDSLTLTMAWKVDE